MPRARPCDLRKAVAPVSSTAPAGFPWTDPDGYENVNIVATAAKPLISALSAQLRAAFAIV